MKKFLVFSSVAALVLVSAAQSQPVEAQPPGTPVTFGVFGGFAFPVGDFSSNERGQSSGGASRGYAFGAEVGVPLQGGFSVLGSATLAFNPLSEDYIREYMGLPRWSGDLGTWTTIWPMVGVRYSGSKAHTEEGFYAQVQIGYLLESSPELDVSYSGTRYTAESTSGGAFAYGFGVGATFARIVNVGLRFVISEPMYVWNVEETQSGPGFWVRRGFYYEDYHPTTIIQILVGVTF